LTVCIYNSTRANTYIGYSELEFNLYISYIPVVKVKINPSFATFFTGINV